MSKLSEGTKHDSSKPRFDLLSPHALNQLALVLTRGAEKYESHNWRKGIAMSRLIAASYRHLNSINEGHDIDAEFGLLHAAHLMCCAMFMVEQTLMRPAFDDRWRPADLTQEEIVKVISELDIPVSLLKNRGGAGG